jgi:hypothetical protein
MRCPGDSIHDALICIGRQLEQGPDVFEYVTLLVVPVAATLATLYIAYVSWQTAKRSTKISERATEIAEAALDAEHERGQAEHDRVQENWRRDYESRLDAHFTQLFEAVGQYSASHDAWLDECSDIEIHWRGDPDEAPTPPAPSRALLDARLQSAMLQARGDDRIVLGKIDGYIREVMRSKSKWKLSHRLTYLVEQIRKWRDGSCTAGTFMSRLKRKRTTIELDRDIPPRRV